MLSRGKKSGGAVGSPVSRVHKTRPSVAINPAVAKKSVAAKKLDVKNLTWKQYIKLSYKFARLGIRDFAKKHRYFSRFVCILLVAVLLFAMYMQIWSNKPKDTKTSIPANISLLIGEPIERYAQKLTMDKKGGFDYNLGYAPTPDTAGLSGSPKISANFGSAENNGVVSVEDTVNKVSFKLTPKFSINSPKKDKNRVVYDILGKNASSIYSAKGASIKEDIVLYDYQGDSMSFDYEMGLPDGTEARVDSNGSVGVYGVTSALLGNVTTGSESDAKLLEKARKNGQKSKLLFTIPAPAIKDSGKSTISARAWYSVAGKILTIHADALKNLAYPISIDPTVYIETAQKLMRGNNESNIDFDPANELIQKSQTTGARINGWADSTEANSGTWDQSVATAAGYVYRAGGRVDPTMPYLVSTQSSTLATAGTSFTVNLPAIRPAGDLYVVLIGHKNAGGAITQTGGGFTEYVDVREHAAYYKVGANVSAGDEAASYVFTSAAATEWVATVMRIKGFNSATPISGTAGTGSSAATTVPPDFPSTTPAADATLVIRAAGVNAIQPSQYGWLPLGHKQVYSGVSSTVTASSAALLVATMDQPPIASGATGVQTLVNDGLTSNSYGASSIAINPATVTAGVQSKLEWAQLNGTTATVDSPNPGTGVCTGWCNNSVYDLPGGALRRGMQMVAYNGYLYAMGGSSFATGGTDATVAASSQNTVWVAKLGVNGEPQLWHPDTGTKAYWYVASNTLPTARMQFATVAYNNKLYIFGGINAAGASLNDVQVADILPTGNIGAWSTTGMQTLPDVRFGHSVQQYNDTFYLIGGNSSGTLRNTVYYSKINSNGTMNAWTPTSSFATARYSGGGSMTGLVGGYIYLAGGCSTLTSGFCSTIAQDVQLASINADGTLAQWNGIITLSNQRIGYSFVAWQGGLYRIGGCNRQNTATGVCYATHQDVEYGLINQDGDASTVNNSNAYNATLTAGNTCSGFANGNASLYNCDLPPPGDNAGQGGQMSSMVVVNNGYIYNIGGCTDVTATCSAGAGMSGNTSYAALSATGNIVAAASCTGGTYVGTWCVDNTNRINGTAGVGAAAATVFNNRIYVVGGTDGTAAWTSTVYYVGVSNSTGALSGAWTAQAVAATGLPNNFPAVTAGGSATTLTTAGIGYGYAFTRANPAAVGTLPANLYVLGGCTGTGSGVSCAAGQMSNGVYKCTIDFTTGAVASCSIGSQLQIDADDINAGNQGLALMSGTIYANYLYLIGGACTQPTASAASDPCGATYAGNRQNSIYAKIDNNNNIVIASGSSWKKATGVMSPIRRRAVSFGYNGYIYSLAGYTGSVSLQDLLFSKINVSTGDFGNFSSSGVVVTPRWDLRAIVSNGYVYAIGGCAVGAAPTCTSLQPQVQTFQLYNNDSGAVNDFTAMGDDTFNVSTNRIGTSSTVLNGYLYTAGGCTRGDCGSSIPTTDGLSDVEYIQLSAVDGTPTGTWSSTTADLGCATAGCGSPVPRVWGQLESVGGYLYYVGGQNTSRIAQAQVYYAQPSAGGNVSSWGTATNGLPAATTWIGGAVWNGRIYVAGGFNNVDVAQNKVYVSPDLSAGGDITAAWSTASTSFNVARAELTLVAYANNLYIMGGFDFPTSYFTDTQYAAIGYKAGTISQTGSTLSGTSTTWTSAMVGSKVLYIDGSTATITAFTNATTLSVNVSKTVVASSPYTIADGNVYAWTYGSTLPFEMRGADGFAANGYMYLIGGVNNSFCYTTTYSAPISANTTIATGNNPTGLGDFYQTNVKYTGARYGASVAYSKGKFYTMGGGCGTSVIASNRHYYSTVKSQPQIAKYSRLIDTDTDVFPQKWLINGLDNSIGASWQLNYKSMHDLDGIVNPSEDCGTSTTMATMANYGYETNYGNVSLGVPGTYTARNGTSYSAGTITQSGTTITGSGFTTDINGGIITYLDGTIATVTYVSATQLTSSVSRTIGSGQTYRIDGGNINCARYFYLSVSIDGSQTYGYPEDVTRGPTLSDITLLFTSDPSKRLMHGRTFTGGEQQPLDAPF